MFTDLFLAIAIVSSPPSPVAATDTATVARDIEPSCMKGPVSVRFRSQAGTIQIAASAIRIEGEDGPAAAQAQSD